ncbi:hypothetical protein BGP75_18145 [Motiliproteus sp. MSK22-1]|nr:hypothetical protein BGP75_18145 [Motiliproteus sp. MSK22-1]
MLTEYTVFAYRLLMSRRKSSEKQQTLRPIYRIANFLIKILFEADGKALKPLAHGTQSRKLDKKSLTADESRDDVLQTLRNRYSETRKPIRG